MRLGHGGRGHETLTASLEGVNATRWARNPGVKTLKRNSDLFVGPELNFLSTEHAIRVHDEVHLALC
jgi:hypothetical protein